MDERVRAELNEKGRLVAGDLLASFDDLPYTGIAYYDREGKPIGMGDWCALREDLDYIVVVRTTLPNALEVSTVWLGLDHNHWGHGPPLIFETMVFGIEWDDGEGYLPSGWGRHDVGYCNRYSTEAEARLAHSVVCVVAASWRGHPVPTP